MSMWLANQIGGFRILAHSDGWEKSNVKYVYLYMYICPDWAVC